jgi:hypothetical protein
LIKLNIKSFLESLLQNPLKLCSFLGIDMAAFL